MNEEVLDLLKTQIRQMMKDMLVTEIRDGVKSMADVVADDTKLNPTVRKITSITLKEVIDHIDDNIAVVAKMTEDDNLDLLIELGGKLMGDKSKEEDYAEMFCELISSQMDQK